MKKINTLLLFVLIIRTTASAQELFNETRVKHAIYNSTLIIEGKVISGKRILLNRTSKPLYSGDSYYLAVIKPTAVLSGNSDSTKTYQVLIENGNYSIQTDSTVIVVPNSGGIPYVPQYGIFFIKENPISFPDNVQILEPNGKIITTGFNTLFPNAAKVKFVYGIAYVISNRGQTLNKKEQILQLLLDKFNLKPKPF